LSTSYGGIRIR